MRATGIVRRIDSLGRFVLPMELRDALGIGPKDPVEIFVNGHDIILRKYSPGCDLCGEVEERQTPYRGKFICARCVREISELNKSAS